MTSKHNNSLTIDYKFNQAELDSRVFQAEVDYEAHIQGSRRYDHEAAKEVVVTDSAKIRIFENSLADALQVFADRRDEGYTLITSAHDFPTVITGYGTQPTIAMTMRKPQHIIDARLAEIKSEIEVVYRAELAAKYEAFIEALAEREVAREEQKEIDRLAAITAKAEVKRGQRIQALKKELVEEFPA
ncbi:hypothetical protein [Pseudomonas sp. rhizo25]|uniref:hypothetical protein n=1 Tax=Pseudomonas sp. rhizo25 TaxID=3059675 RepID=UPI0028905686|nr:hypothetical protein [Pseudomonas sp. rhizo25]MDT3231245.1 hypothetical protein [Pseudomonas sp. rhizo25]